MSDDSNAPADLSNFGMDLSQIFRPAWTVESTDSTARLAAKFDEGDRPSRPYRDGGQGGDRRSGGQGRGPGGPGRDRDARGPRPQFGGRDAKGGQGGSKPEGRGAGDRSRSRDPRDRQQEERRPEPAPKPMLEGWKISLVPEPSAIEAITKQIRSRAKAYPLFELARLIVQLSERYSIRLKAEEENSPELFRVKTDGSVWTSRKAAISHLLSKHIEKFYRRTSITVEATKGSYSVVAQCGMSGVLLGPPNHHEYQSRLLALHAARFKNLPFEVYKTRIKMMRDEALMEQWKTEQSTRTVFIPVKPGSESAAATEETPAAIEEVITTETSIPAAEIPSAEGEAAPATEATEPTPETQIPETAETAESIEAASEESPAASDEKGLTLEEAIAHFNEHHAGREVESASREFTTPGHVALHGSDPLLRELLLKTLQEMDHFPLPLAQQLGKELTGHGLQIYKAHKKIIHVSVARPRYLDRKSNPIAEGFRSILDYLEAHPNQHRDKQWAGLLALRPLPEGTTEETPAEETLKLREQSLGTDLLWLLHQGHVLDFAMGNLQAALPPLPKANAEKPAQPTPEKAAQPTASKSAQKSKASQPAAAASESAEPLSPVVEEASPAEEDEESEEITAVAAEADAPEVTEVAETPKVIEEEIPVEAVVAEPVAEIAGEPLVESKAPTLGEAAQSETSETAHTAPSAPLKSAE